MFFYDSFAFGIISNKFMYPSPAESIRRIYIWFIEEKSFLLQG